MEEDLIPRNSIFLINLQTPGDKIFSITGHINMIREIHSKPIYIAKQFLLSLRRPRSLPIKQLIKHNP